MSTISFSMISLKTLSDENFGTAVRYLSGKSGKNLENWLIDNENFLGKVRSPSKRWSAVFQDDETEYLKNDNHFYIDGLFTFEKIYFLEKIVS